MSTPEKPGLEANEKPKINPADRTFLVVVDTSEELKAALRFACRRPSVS